jgi:hypothetical protein
MLSWASILYGATLSAAVAGAASPPWCAPASRPSP